MLPSKRQHSPAKDATPAFKARVSLQAPASESGHQADAIIILLQGGGQRVLHVGKVAAAELACFTRHLHQPLLELFQQAARPICCNPEMHQAVQRVGVALDDQAGVYVNTLVVPRQKLLTYVEKALKQPDSLPLHSLALFLRLDAMRQDLPAHVPMAYVGTATNTMNRVRQEEEEESLVGYFYKLAMEELDGSHHPVVIVTGDMINRIIESLHQGGFTTWNAERVRYLCEAVMCELLGSNVNMAGLNVGACGGGHQATSTCAMNVAINELSSQYRQHHPDCSDTDAKAATLARPASEALHSLGAVGLLALLSAVIQRGVWAKTTGPPGEGQQPTMRHLQSAICAHCGHKAQAKLDEEVGITGPLPSGTTRAAAALIPPEELKAKRSQQSSVGAKVSHEIYNISVDGKVECEAGGTTPKLYFRGLGYDEEAAVQAARELFPGNTVTVKGKVHQAKGGTVSSNKVMEDGRKQAAHQGELSSMTSGQAKANKSTGVCPRCSIKKGERVACQVVPGGTHAYEYNNSQGRDPRNQQDSRAAAKLRVSRALWDFWVAESNKQEMDKARKQGKAPQGV